MGRLTIKKSKKKHSSVSNRKSLKGGAMGVLNNLTTESCNFDTKFRKTTAEILGYTKKNLLSRADTSDFTKLENQKYMNIFKRNLEIFCNKNQNGKYIKFCINFLSCADKPNKIYDLLYQMYITNIPNERNQSNLKDKDDSCPEEEQKKYKLTKFQQGIYKRRKKRLDKYYSERGQDGFDETQDDKKITSKNYCLSDFVKEYEQDNIKNVSKFFINVIKKSIVSYEKTKPPKDGESSEIYMKDKLEKSLTNVFGTKFEFNKITQESLEKLFTEKRKNILDYSEARLMSTTSEELVDDDKDVKKSPFYMYLVFGAFLTALVLESGYMAAPPGLKGGMS